MGWQAIAISILTSLISSGAIAAGVGYILKKSFERAIDYRFEKLLEEHRANIQEDTRRKAMLFDEQYETLKQAVALAYRLRNSTRDLVEMFSSDEVSERMALRKIEEIEQDMHAIRELLYNKRLILPPLLFQLIHDIYNIMVAVNSKARLYFLQRNKSKIDIQATENLSEILKRIEDGYNALIFAAQSQINMIQSQQRDLY